MNTDTSKEVLEYQQKWTQHFKEQIGPQGTNLNYEVEIKSGSGMPQTGSALTGQDSSQMFLNKNDESRDEVICIPETVIKKNNMEDMNNNAREAQAHHDNTDTGYKQELHIYFYGDQRVETEVSVSMNHTAEAFNKAAPAAKMKVALPENSRNILNGGK